MDNDSTKGDIDKFFRPRAVAIIGASREQDKPGRVIFDNMRASFKGKVYPVNPNTSEIDGVRCYKSIMDLPAEVDHVVLVIPAPFVPASLEECGKKGIKNAVVISGGFGETGRRDLEEQLVSIVNQYGVRVVGPNCLGLIDMYSGINSFFLPAYRVKYPKPGPVTFLTQSGAVGGVGMDYAAKVGIGISKIVSYGNRLDVDEPDMLDYLKNDDTTKVVMIYMEGTRRGREFIRAARDVSKTKPIVLFKVGRGAYGAKAVSSHTGSLAGDNAIYETAFDKAGVIQANTLEEMFDYAKVFSMQHPAKGNRVAVITSGGGFGVMASDAVEAAGLKLADLSDNTRKELRAAFPPHVGVNNPIDIVGDADAERYRVAIEKALADPNVDAVLLIFLMQLPRVSSDVLRLVEQEKRKSEKPIVGVSCGSEFSDLHMKILEEGIGIPVFETPERGVKALKALVDYGAIQEKLRNEEGIL